MKTAHGHVSLMTSWWTHNQSVCCHWMLCWRNWDNHSLWMDTRTLPEDWGCIASDRPQNLVLHGFVQCIFHSDNVLIHCTSVIFFTWVLENEADILCVSLLFLTFQHLKPNCHIISVYHRYFFVSISPVALWKPGYPRLNTLHNS